MVTIVGQLYTFANVLKCKAQSVTMRSLVMSPFPRDFANSILS